MVSTITPVDNKQGKYPKLKLKQSITLLETLRSCWSEDVLVISCSDKFLRLSLQLLSRSDFTSPVWMSLIFSVILVLPCRHLYIHTCIDCTHSKVIFYFLHVIGIQLGYLLVWLLEKGIAHCQTLLPILSGLSWLK